MPADRSEWELLLELRRRADLLREIEHSKQDEFALQARLRKSYPQELVRAALSLADARRKARDKFSLADRMWVDRLSLEQATAEIVAAHKARRFASVIPEEETVWDLCSGLGGDAIALARSHRVCIVDQNPIALLRACWNAEVYAVRDRLRPVCAKVEHLGLRDCFLHVDPDRRPEGKRSRRIEGIQPGLEVLRDLIEKNRGGAIKLSPASNFGGKFDDCEVELISLHGECKEATVWFGELRTEFPYRATALPSGETLAGDPLSVWTEVREPGAYLYDPDPAIVRAGLVDLLADRYGLARMDSAEEYLTADHPVQSPFLQSFRILDAVPYQTNALKKRFREGEFGQLEIKCRHVKVDIESLRRKLPLPGSKPGTLVIGKTPGKTLGLICERWTGLDLAAE